MKSFYIYRANVAYRLFFVLSFGMLTLFFNSCSSMYLCPTYFKADAQKYRGENSTAQIYGKYKTKKPSSNRHRR